jgi:hypothetical protein
VHVEFSISGDFGVADPDRFPVLFVPSCGYWRLIWNFHFGFSSTVEYTPSHHPFDPARFNLQFFRASRPPTLILQAKKHENRRASSFP